MGKLGKIERIPTERIQELLEDFTIRETAVKLGVSHTGLQHQMKLRGLKGKQGHSPRCRARLRAATLAHYGHDEKDLLGMLQDLGLKLGHKPRKRDFPEGFPVQSVFTSRFGSWAQVMELAGLGSLEAAPRKTRKRKPRSPRIRKRAIKIPLEERVYKHMVPRLRYAVLERDKFRCIYCGRSPKEHGVVLQIDHITPQSLGGATTFKNLVSCCVECNQGKHNNYSTNPLGF